MENKLLLEEIKRFKLLSGYDNRKTEYENNKSLTEQEGEVRDFIKALSDLKQTGEYRSIESAVLKDLGREIKVGGKELKSIEEIAAAMREGKLVGSEASEFLASLLKNTKEGSAFNKATLEVLATKESTLNFASKFKTAEEFADHIKTNSKSIMSPTQAEEFAKKAFEAREVKDVKDADELAKARELEQPKSEREIESSKEERRRQETSNQRERESERYQTEKEKIDLENERLLRQTDTEAREAMAKMEQTNAKVREIKNKQDLIEAETRLMKEKEALAELKNSKPNVVLHWLKTNGFVRFLKNAIFNKWVWILAGGGLAAYWAWNKFFKDNGIKVECEEGKVVDPKTGDCVDPSKIEGGNSSNNGTSPGGQNSVGTGGSEDGGSGTGGSGTGGSEDGVNDGITYKNCRGTYSLGCKDLPGMDTIAQLQKCLAVKQTGKFGKNTERELESATGEKTIDRDGIRLLCGNF